MDWWKAHHGIATDAKYRVIMRHIASHNVTVAHQLRLSDVIAIWVWLIDFASQNKPRGTIEGFEIDHLAVDTGLSDESVEVVVNAMRNRGMISGNSLTAFDKRNPSSTIRMRHKRAKDSPHEETASQGVTGRHSSRAQERDGDGDDVVVSRELPGNRTKQGKTDVTTKRTAHNGSGNGNGHHTSVPLQASSSFPDESDPRIPRMEIILHSYMGMDGTEFERTYDKPDKKIVLRCLAAIGPKTDMDSVARFLHDRFSNHEQSPRHGTGPKKYSWFPTVLKTQFGGHAT